jgi:NAD(P)-dependent dehydrogenase (short-subunit alcohol dehydrogenase family)
MDATALLRPGLLAGRVVAFGGGDALAPPLAALGARVVVLPPHDEDETMAAAVPADADALVHDLRPAFEADGLQASLDLAWIAVRALATSAFIPDGRGGKIVLVAPPSGLGDPAAAARAAAENLARTLSIEWARHGITTVAITPGANTDDAQLAALAAYLASPAGDYFSGARLALGEVAPA